MNKKKLKPINFALIGSGDIAKCHAKVIKSLNHNISTILINTTKKENIEFCKEFNIKHIKTDINEFKNNAKLFDAIIICTPWYLNESLLEETLNLNKPILVEKPITLSKQKLINLNTKYNFNNILIGCNRRYYDFIPKLKQLIKKNTIINVDVLSAEPFKGLNKNHNLKDNMLYFYSIHIIDLLFEILGSLKLIHCKKIEDDEKTHYVLTLNSDKHSCTVQIKIILDLAQNSYIKIFSTNQTIELLPLETMNIYKEMKRVVLNNNTKYTPKLEKNYQTSNKYKPGFENQLKYFINSYIYETNKSEKEFQRAYEIMELFEQMKDIKT